MLFKVKQTRRHQTKLKTATINKFTGGWNAVDDDTNLSTRFAVVLKNFHRGTNDNQKLRFGTSWFADVSSVVTGNIINQAYFNGRIIAVTDDGEIATVDSAGAVVAVWNTMIAAALVGSPSAWTNPIVRANFVSFRDTLLIHNGTDKPLSVSSSFAVTYLQDLATGANANVPIGKFGTVAQNYHCVAGISSNATLIYVSAVGTSGVFPGDPAPNDSISFDVGAYSPSQSDEIRGLHTYRNQLIVFFNAAALLITLGTYNDAGVHTPIFSDEIPAFGLLGQRGAVAVINDLLFMDIGGVNSAKRNLFAGLIETDRVSDLIAPAYQADWTNHTPDEQQDETFAVYNRLDGQVLFCDIGHGKVYVLTFDAKLRKKTWSEYTGWSWTCACSSSFGRMFFAEGTRIFQYGNKAFTGEDYAADKLDDRDSDWDISTAYIVDDLIRDTLTNESYTCVIAHTSPSSGTFANHRAINTTHWELYTGVNIALDWELPWSDASAPMKVKGLRYIAFDGSGIAAFTLEAYVDDLYKDGAGNVVHDPALSLEFVGADSGGFGEPTSPIPFGGGRKMNHPLLWSYPIKFKTVKFRITGATKRPLSISAIHLLYATGGYKRAGGL